MKSFSKFFKKKPARLTRFLGDFDGLNFAWELPAVRLSHGGAAVGAGLLYFCRVRSPFQ